MKKISIWEVFSKLINKFYCFPLFNKEKPKKEEAPKKEEKPPEEDEEDIDLGGLF